jgi:prepilin-type N-terminal cleavage/methylation domain-containing protein
MHLHFHSRRGFSLLELLLVAAVLTVMAGLTLPQFKNTYHQIILKNAVSDLVYTMRYAGSRSLIKNKNHRLEFDSDFKSYWLTEVSEKQDKAFEKISGSAGKIVRLPALVAIQSDQTTIDFFSDGSMEKEDINVCFRDDCYVVSTAHKRGKVTIIKNDD